MKTLIALIALALVGWGIYAMVNNDNSVTPTGETQTTNNAGGSDYTPAPGTASTSTPATSTASAVKEFTVKGANFSFTPSALTVNKGDRVKIVFQNTGGTHDWVIDEFNARTGRISGGQSETIEFVADKTGSFEYYCSVGTHRQMGMRGTLTVK